MLRTKRYFGIDKDGKAETLKDGSSTGRKTDSRAFSFTLAENFPLYLKEKSTTFVQSVHTLSTRCLDLSCRVDLLKGLQRYESKI